MSASAAEARKLESQDRGEQAGRRLRVVWQDPDTRRFHEVATLLANHDNYVFAYTTEARVLPQFRPFFAFPELERTYHSQRLFPFFENRVMSARRPDYDEYLSALGLTRLDATPLELLARSAGRRATDTIQVVPESSRDEQGRESQLFLASGARHIEGAENRIRALRADEELLLRPQPENEVDPRALLIDTSSGQPVGWIPNYLLDEVHKNREAGAEVRCFVEQANGPDTPWHLRLLCRLVTG
jgi:hypothetical protein